MRQRSLWRMLLIALGTATVCVAFLGWLAVLDVDHLEILPLNGTLVVGSLILGTAMGFTGYTPGSMLAQLGGGKPLAGLCAVAGGVAGAVCYGWIASPVEAINGWFPEIAGTLSRTTLTSPFLLSGGFLLHGAVGVILLFAAFAYRGFRIAANSPNRFCSLVVMGLTLQVSLQAILNIAVVTNTLPSTGISLPFFSYGGTSLVILMVEMGVILSISRYSYIERG